MPVAVPVLPVSDLDRAIAFYGTLGSGLVSRYDQYAIVSLEGAEVHLTCTEGIDPACTTSGAYLRVDDAAEVHHRWIGAGAREVAPLADQPYGITEFATEDPDGNLWRVGSPTAP